MYSILASISVVDVFMRCDLVGKVIVCGLAVASIIAWAVMIGKRNDLAQLRRLNLAFDQHLRDQRSLLDLPESYRNKRSIPYGDLFADAINAYWRAAEIGKAKGIDTKQYRLEHTENALQRALSRQILNYESSMVFLASIVSGAPFLGLLGTVWGVMESFNAVTVQQTASIQTLAPGVASALLTTVAGLVVAIPSMFGYNYLFSNNKRLITELENFASSLSDRIELESQ
ncbi:biopolymer transport protein TolQ [Ereboglobus sp. PH5-5]|uniref:MotA/TolQ/ExbB proton channel family protein n=1 Tax=unclassified Ereboglobus TaxID=2626932 RepID=UPI00240643CA|nr:MULTISPECIES: MotA/TolQ/ExbB proton channel family protein [unclassified Ereboglobus]MDF9826363.1 biopolymer transport protein TolQ [Ereboglobus sp. PH5-10]MDF9833018.1 biopolymer transport protein TolQ [Ereboglobus sp. PH5-5]